MVETFDNIIYKVKAGNYFRIPVISDCFEALKRKHHNLKNISSSIDDNGNCIVEVQSLDLARNIWLSCGDLKAIY